MKHGVENPGWVVVTAVSVLLAVHVSPAVATITTVGDIDPLYEGADPWILAGELIIGVTGDANLVISDGSGVIDTRARIAAGAESESGVLVTGAGSLWENSGTLFLGEFGTGTLTVADGASLTTPGLVAGSEVGSVGSLIVTGPGTVWQGTPAIIGGISEIPLDPNASSETEVVAIIGRHGTGNVTISDGARVTADRGLLYLGYWQDGVGSLTVTGPNSVWEDTGTIHVGHFGAGTLLISDGGAVIGTKNAYIGASYWPLHGNPTTSHGSVTVTDPGSLWRVGGTLMVGDIGQGELLVSAGGRVESKWGYVNDLATVTGAGSLWQNELSLTVQGPLNIEAGGQVTDANAYVGYTEDSNGSVSVTGAGSVWDNSAKLQVGVAGSGTVYIQDGGRVTSSGGYIGNASSADGNVLLRDAGSVWDNSAELHVGVAGDGAVYIEEGGRVTSRTGVLGMESTATGFVIVDWPDSVWEISPDPNSGLGGELTVGQAGLGQLHIGSFLTSGVAGGTITARDAVMAAEANSESLVTVNGQDSRLQIERNLVVGLGGDARLGISEGGQVSSMTATLAQEAGSSAEVTMTGANSLWNNLDRLEIGRAGNADVTVLIGAQLVSVSTFIAAAPGGTGAVLVNGTGSRLVSFNLDVGEYGQGSVTVTDAGGVSAGHTIIGARPGGVGSGLVSGPDSVWENTGILDVGYEGVGLLTVAEGGRVTSGDARIGVHSGATGTVVLTGPDSLWTNTNILYVGGSDMGTGGTGTLVIENGATAESGSVVVWYDGMIAGDGTLKGNEVFNQGIIRPGASMGTLTIDGDLVLGTDGTLEIEIDNQGNSDKVLVTGNVLIPASDEAVIPVPTETIVGQHQYSVVEANSVSWPNITVMFGYDTALLKSVLIWGWPEEPNSVFLHVGQVPFDDPYLVQTDNQRSLGGALQEIAEQGGNDVTMALQQLLTVGEVHGAYDQLSGRTMPSLAPVTVAGTTRYLGTVSNRLRRATGAFARDTDPQTPGPAGSDGMLATDMLRVDAGRYLFAVGNGSPYFGDKPWGAWGKGFGLFGDRESESGVPGYQYTIYGTSFGLDYRFTDRLLLGLTGGYAEGDVDYAGSRDNADVESTHVGLYGSYDTSRWYLDSILAYGDLDYETRRYVDLLGERLEGDPSGDLYSGYLEAGLNRWCRNKTLVQPLAAFQFSILDLDSFTETGGTSALRFDDERHESYKGSLGVKVTRELFEHADGCRAALELRGRWVHEFGDTKASLDAEFADVPGVAFRVSDEDISRDSAILGAGLDTWFARRARLFLDYGVELNADNTIHLVSAGLEYRW